ncbi:MAG TPA: radical SAM protein [Bacteroidales bacterium]|nr:radical SAM protein [Bacteroidales bacterium]HNU22169.1 radical SAM protein [Bacteroidales bacterium]HNV17666.1 radical SAM protein [Bacteroidales bacterium]HNZ79794.1 radical SAM protein [Bacteroidales bacterium]HOC16216.1 radical SAM protein [Bacteroidales bacterium]
MNKKTLILINPSNQYRRGFALRQQSRQVPLGLGIIAALTPPNWKIIILDENIKPFRFREADLVGITTFTSTAQRAYEIAAVYRGKGIPVVFGGIHVSMLPDEALQYGDAVVIGEAETSWPNVMSDFEAGRLQRIYRGPHADLSQCPIPRHDLFHPSYLFASIQTSRGCPMDCDFCSVPVFNGHSYRLRPVEAILDEMEALPQKLIYFVDDNITGYSKASEKHAQELFEGMIRRGLKKEWFAQASLNISQNPELLKLAARSGCKMLLIGIEAENENALRDTNKHVNLTLGTKTYKHAFRTIHQAGIAVLGAFIYGMDSDTPSSLQARTKFIVHSSVDVVQASAITPLPGTRLFKRLQQENRILANHPPHSWKYFHFSDVVFRPAEMQAHELADNLWMAYQKIFSLKTLRMKFLRTLWNTKNLRTSVWAWNSNLNYRAVSMEEPPAVGHDIQNTSSEADYIH